MTDDVVAELRASLHGDVDDSTRRRAEYSTDASNYRVPPLAVAFPRSAEDVVAAVEVCRDAGIPLTARGGGTSIAGNSIGPGIVLDLSKHLSRVISVDPQARTAVVEPGVVLADLQAAAAPHGLRFGPDPSTHARCTLGGMIGNNACGPHTVSYGRTVDNVVELDMVDGTGRRFSTADGMGVVPGLDELVVANLAVLRTEFGRFKRQISGYSLEHLLPERGGDLAKALVGTEGTCALVLATTVRLVEPAPAPALVVLGYPDTAAAAEAVPALLRHEPLALEGLDARIVDVVRARRGASAVPELPRGGGLLFAEVTDADMAARVAADSGALDVRVLPAGDEARRLWAIREDGAGLSGRTPAGRQAWPGWEDAAVPPERLGSYLRRFDELLAEYGVEGLPYGHFGDGCVHVRLDLPLADRPERLQPFLTDAAKLVVEHGGSLSGEHGDGRARSELLPLMYSAEALAAFAGFRALLDPDRVLNPEIGPPPDGAAVDADLRRPAAKPLPAIGTGFAYAHDDGDFTNAVHRCVGVGKCRADPRKGVAGTTKGFMCPSWVATGDEKDNTRGRARVLQEMANGTLVKDGWKSAEVHDVLDLCLSCKACASDCPAGVDMATYKAEVLHRTYRRRLRPRTHYSLGWLPRWARLAGAAPRVVNAVLRSPLRPLLLRAGGMDPRRAVPAFARVPFRRRNVERAEAAERPSVVLWVDTFSGAFSPDVAEAAVRVLDAAGYHVLPAPDACCGLPWITTGQLDAARTRLRRLLDALAPHAEAGTPIVGLEPSCVGVLRGDLTELLPGDPRARTLAEATRTLAEVLRSAPGPLPRLDGVRVLAQPHCHHHAVMSYAADTALLRELGAEVEVLGGCCGLAGNWGMEQGHYDVSVAVAEASLLPALRAAEPGTVLLADGFSCRTQAEQLGGVGGMHLAQLLAGSRP